MYVAEELYKIQLVLLISLQKGNNIVQSSKVHSNYSPNSAIVAVSKLLISRRGAWRK